MNQGGRILRALSRIGYPKANEFEGDTLEWLFDCKSVVPFLEWLCENIHESNVLSVEDLKRFNELHSSGAYILENDQVEKTLSMLLHEEEEFSSEVLSLHHTGLTHKLSKLNTVVQEHKQKYKASLESSQADNTLGIAEMAGREEKSRYDLLEISDPSTLLVRGENGDVNFNDCQELARLQSVYASSESKRIHNMATATGVTTALKTAEERLKSLSWETNPPGTDIMSAKLLEVQKALSQVKMEIGELTEKALPGLVQELGELQATSILKGDYELKIARQDYFTSKQDQVITQLLLQRSRHEFLSMTLEVEGRKNRDTHRLFSTLESTLGDAVKGMEARSVSSKY
ncbi:spindle assembly [Desmophyllum pertusum]|uniref:Spindle assembly n=1 Tax=Desmophyllum pertusum TaxID=174260 RepID=A0A9X0CGY5_9CNID|nr:spindle assembly [Desmophyllum pertusum]